MLRILEIILRARQNFLVDKFRTETVALSAELISEVHSSWTAYVQSNVTKGLGANESLPAGDEEAAWPRLAELFQNKAWKQECLKRDEKFDMYFSAAVRQAPMICDRC